MPSTPVPGPVNEMVWEPVAVTMESDEVANVPEHWPHAERNALSAPNSSELARSIELLRTKRTALFIGGSALDKSQLALAQRIASATSAKVIMETFPAIMDHGDGIESPERLIYFAEFAASQLKDAEALILIGAREPVSFFAYPDIPSVIAPEDCEVLNLCPPGTDTNAALEFMAHELHAPSLDTVRGEAPAAPAGALFCPRYSAANRPASSSCLPLGPEMKPA